jgi:peptidoglycan-N-acetylglucosamine deacetylase
VSLSSDIFVVGWPAAAGAAVACGVLAHGTFGPRSSFWGTVVSRAPRGDGRGVALTFDDGPTPDATDRILDVLGGLRVRAAFFVVGCNAAKYPRLVERIHAEGHLVGNHTLDHPHYGLFRRDGYWKRQVEETDETVRRIIGRRPAMFRPPMGIKTWHTIKAAASAGHTVVTWTRRAFDGIGTSSERIVARLAPTSEAGDILLLHDGVEPKACRRDPSATVAALRPLVEGLRARGLEPRPLDEMLSVRAYSPDPAVLARLAEAPCKRSG